MRVIAVVQARYGSTRLPGKVLAHLEGIPVLEHVIRRAQRSRCVDEVVVATTTTSDDDIVASFGSSLGAGVVRGPVDDVLSRYVEAARWSRADVVVRVTADCPLLDPRLVDRVLRTLTDEGADYASNIDPPTYPDGYDVEALTVSCLARIDAAATLPHLREHVTAHVRENPHRYRTAAIRCRRDYSALRFTVDTFTDLQRLRRLLAALPSEPPPGLGAVLGAVTRIPALANTTDSPSRDQSYLSQLQALFASDKA